MPVLEQLDALLSYGGLVGLATASVYAGSLGSFRPPKKPRHKSPHTHDDSEPESSEDEEFTDRLSASEAILFPIMGSIVLGGFYLAFKYLGEDWINKMLGYYFCLMGIGCVWSCLVSLTKRLVGPARYRATPRFRLTLTVGPRSRSKSLLAWRLPTLLLLPFAAAPSIAFFWSDPKSAFMTDILALSFSHTALSTMKVDSLQTGCILLGGLFIYDVWWVFGTTVMVTVATTLTIPIKLLWPRSVLTVLSILPSSDSTHRNMLLGLGDVVIPGTVVALAYRFDMHLQEKNKAHGSDYFRATLVGYVVGLSMAFGAMHVFKVAQPALLYLSPSCCLSFIFTALRRGEWAYVCKWEDGAVVEKETNGSAKKEEDKSS